jgi:hypothetical protein
MRFKKSRHQTLAELAARDAAVGNQLDKATDPAAMRLLLRERRFVRTALDAVGRPR